MDEKITCKIPWKDSVGGIPLTLDYFEGSLFDAVEATAGRRPKGIAYDFMGRSTSYEEFLADTVTAARALRAFGVGPGDKVTVAMPNCPQAICIFYAINGVGAVANMVHPLSGEKELEFYVRESRSETVVTLDQFVPKFGAVLENTPARRLVAASVADALSLPVRLGYRVSEGKKIPKLPEKFPVPLITWKDFLKEGKKYTGAWREARRGEDPAVILYSGGTTGITKGILLSNRNFNALGAQINATNPMFREGDRMLAAMPLFHGFGLGVCIHSMLYMGGRCVLVPRFTPKSYARLIVKYRCNFIAGVPTLYEALLRIDDLNGKDLSCLKGVFSGGDSLSVELKKKLDRFLKDRGAEIPVREGYGTTETVTACCLTPPHLYREGSIGVPFPDTYIKIVEPGTDRELPYGEEGEILLAGPTVMLEYVGHPEETEKTLRKHADGLTWVYTGDLGTMDEQGFIYFKGRAKRMIVSSGYNIYPAQLENVFDAHDKITMSCVIGVPDSYRMARPKVFVVLKPGVEKSEETRQEILAYAAKYIARYALPKELEFRDELPKTLVGKVAYRKLEEEEAAKRAAGGTQT